MVLKIDTIKKELRNLDKIKVSDIAQSKEEFPYKDDESVFGFKSLGRCKKMNGIDNDRGA